MTRRFDLRPAFGVAIGLTVLSSLSCKSRTQSTDSRFRSELVEPQGRPELQGTDLKALLESSKSKEEYEKYFQLVEKLPKPLTYELIRDAVPEETRLYAGKYIFVYGVPQAANAVPGIYLSGAMKAWPELVGPAFEKAGLIANPDDPEFPIGFPRVKSFNRAMNIALAGRTRNAAACAMCHLSQLPDGRYSFGMPNQSLNSGRIALVFSYPIWSLDQLANDPQKWDPELIRQFSAMKKQASESGVFGTVLPSLTFIPKQINVTHFLSMAASLPLLGPGDQRDMLTNSQGSGPAFYVALGTKEPLVLSTPSLWGMKSYPERPYDLDKNRVSSFFPAPDLETHMAEALYLNAGGDKTFAGVEWQVPLTDFVRSLRAPQNLNPRNDELYRIGEAIFSKSCVACHRDDQGGSGLLISHKRMQLFEKYSAPYALSAEPSGPLSARNFETIQKMMLEEHPDYDFQKRGVRPRRIKGVWALTHLMSNGAVKTLDHALCLQGRTRTESKSPSHDLSDAVHSDLCTSHTEDERLALKEFLSHWN